MNKYIFMLLIFSLPGISWGQIQCHFKVDGQSVEFKDITDVNHPSYDEEEESQILRGEGDRFFSEVVYLPYQDYFYATIRDKKDSSYRVSTYSDITVTTSEFKYSFHCSF